MSTMHCLHQMQHTTSQPQDSSQQSFSLCRPLHHMHQFKQHQFQHPKWQPDVLNHWVTQQILANCIGASSKWIGPQPPTATPRHNSHRLPSSPQWWSEDFFHIQHVTHYHGNQTASCCSNHPHDWTLQQQCKLQQQSQYCSLWFCFQTQSPAHPTSLQCHMKQLEQLCLTLWQLPTIPIAISSNHTMHCQPPTKKLTIFQLAVPVATVPGTYTISERPNKLVTKFLVLKST